MEQFNDKDLLPVDKFFVLYQRLNPKSLETPISQIAIDMIEQYDIYKSLHECGLTNNQCIKHINNV